MFIQRPSLERSASKTSSKRWTDESESCGRCLICQSCFTWSRQDFGTNRLRIVLSTGALTIASRSGLCASAGY